MLLGPNKGMVRCDGYQGNGAGNDLGLDPAPGASIFGLEIEGWEGKLAPKFPFHLRGRVRPRPNLVRFFGPPSGDAW